MIDTSEKNLETVIFESLTGSDGHVAEIRPPYGSEWPSGAGYVTRKTEAYDRSLCLLPGDVIDFVVATQPATWDKLKKQHGENARTSFLMRLTKEIGSRGTLDVLRKGVDDSGCHFHLAYFRPETGLNPDHERLYNANILAAVRQLRYSERNENSLNLALFVNGLPVVTAELKNPLKNQNVQHAIQQYRHDRDPKESLFTLGRCLAHFAVDTDLVYMATELRGLSTRFLPFNKGFENGAGNPPNSSSFKTAYLWIEVWQRDSMLDLLNHFLVRRRALDEDGKETGRWEVIFPRYHQLQAARRLVRHARANGAGQRYLIQHSAGSGKSNTIAWLAHQLTGLHDSKNERVFDTIVVITDRRVLDSQLRQTIRSFAQVRGIVTAIEKNKSTELAKALEKGRDIIVTTLQTFPFVVDKIGELPGSRFAVVIDEAHSSQSGETTASLKKVLSVSSLEEAEEEDAGGELDAEDQVNAAAEAVMKKRGPLANVSFFAFTATPKQKTLELFGVRREIDGKYEPFHLYPMRQAIEEEFILDVLKHYTTHKVYFSLLKRIEDDPRYDRKKATFLLKSYADKHEVTIARKTAIMVDHFDSTVRKLIDGQAKAMVVTRSRLHAVRYKQAFDRYLKERKLPYKALVAFSGEVTDPDTGESFTEYGMNGIPESQTADAFKQPEYRFLIVAEKFQTGFDQPLLHTMYVDKKLVGLNAVQTLSRLNRMHPAKKDTFVLDFANDPDEIQKAFQPYYESTILTEGSDPNKLYDLKRLIEDFHLCFEDDVEAFAAVYFSPKGTQQQLQPVLDEVVRRYTERSPEEQAEFRSHLNDYVRLYSFLSQILPFSDSRLEKFYQFTRHLARKLPVTRDRLPVEVTQAINMDSLRIQQTSTGDIKLINEDGELVPISDVAGKLPSEQDMAPLSEIVQYINENYGTDFTDADKVNYFADDMERRLSDRSGLKLAFNPSINPSVDNQKLAFKHHFEETLEDMIDGNLDIYKKIKEDPAFAALFQAALFSKLQQVLSNPVS